MISRTPRYTSFRTGKDGRTFCSSAMDFDDYGETHVEGHDHPLSASLYHGEIVLDAPACQAFVDDDSGDVGQRDERVRC